MFLQISPICILFTLPGNLDLGSGVVEVMAIFSSAPACSSGLENPMYLQNFQYSSCAQDGFGSLEGEFMDNSSMHGVQNSMRVTFWKSSGKSLQTS